MAPHNDQRLLPSLAQAVGVINNQGSSISTSDFANLIEKIGQVFDILGSVLALAKGDIVEKNESLKRVASSHATLDQVVEADKRAGKVTVKNSCARNLHRLTSVISFMRILLEKLLEGPHVSVSEAASTAYDATLAKIHPYVVRTAVWAGRYLLPSREVFMQHLHETEESAKEHAHAFVAAAKSVEDSVHQLYDQPMPASNNTAGLGLGSMFGWGSSAATGK